MAPGMKNAVYLSPLRHYRRQYTRHAGEHAFQVVVEETDLHVTASRDLSHEIQQYVSALRGQLKAYIMLHPEFRDSYVPVPVAPGAASIVRRMAGAATLADVGPMAAVAGTISQMVCEEFAPICSELIVENGGDVYMRSSRDRVAGLLPDPHSESTVGIVIRADEFPVSLCSSSSTIGHSLSLGTGELVAVRSRDGSLADACATAFCNMLTSPEELDKVTERAAELQAQGVDGVFAQCGGRVAIWGKMELAVV